jgi:hypothetical protein
LIRETTENESANEGYRFGQASPPEFVLGSPSSVSFSPKETIRYGEPYPSFLLSFFSKAVNWMQFHFLAEKPYWVFSSDS